MEPDTSRRDFLRTSAAVIPAAASARRVLGANDRIRLGVIGTGSRGSYLMRCLGTLGGIEWVAVCDIYDVRREKAAEFAGPHVRQYLDYHQLLDHKDIDAVVIATPDHWHAQMTIDACRAGKDVYVEKPMTSVPEQGPEVVKAVRETGRIVQVGVQQRSVRHYIEAKQKIVEPGLLGKVGLVRTWYNANQGYTVPVPPGMEKKPEGLDWDRYLGWLPKMPWDPKRYFNRFAYWDISTGGQTGGLFVHLVDTVHWYLGLEKPSAAVAGGGIYHFNDGRDTPDVINLIVEYPQELNVTFEAEILTTPPGAYAAVAGMEFHGTGGVLSVFRYTRETGYLFVPRVNRQDKITGPGFPTAPEPHLTNWLDCVRSRNKPVADEESGHYSAMACHMGNLAYRQKQRITWRKEWDI